MLDLADIPFFTPLPCEALLELRRSVEFRSYPAGSLICRKGEAGQAFFAIASGGVLISFTWRPEGRRSTRRIRTWFIVSA
jgi:hypothetical protein